MCYPTAPDALSHNHRNHLKLDLQFFSGEKTEKATPHKRKEARKKGQVAKSQEIPSTLILLTGFIFLMIFGSEVYRGTEGILRTVLLEYPKMELTSENVEHIFLNLTLEVAKLVAPFLVAAFIVAFFGNYVQVGLMFNPISAKLSKLDPIQGAKKIFALRALVELVKSILKIVAATVVAYLILYGSLEDLLRLPLKSVEASAVTVTSLAIDIGLFVSALLFLIALLDYFYQRYDYEKNLKMSKQDIKDEHKKQEGDPLIKGKIKERQRAMAMQRMMQDVPKADVIITNPTHFAVAVRYDQASGRAPYVLAKGTDALALKIRELAKANSIQIVENKPLARALYASVDIGREIPEDLFKATAEVLAYVYRIKRGF